MREERIGECHPRRAGAHDEVVGLDLDPHGVANVLRRVRTHDVDEGRIMGGAFEDRCHCRRRGAGAPWPA